MLWSVRGIIAKLMLVTAYAKTKHLSIYCATFPSLMDMTHENSFAWGATHCQPRGGNAHFSINSINKTQARTISIMLMCVCCVTNGLPEQKLEILPVHKAPVFPQHSSLLDGWHHCAAAQMPPETAAQDPRYWGGTSSAGTTDKVAERWRHT